MTRSPAVPLARMWATLGQSSIAMTLDRSSHVAADVQRDGAARLADALDRALGTPRDHAVTNEAAAG